MAEGITFEASQLVTLGRDLTAAGPAIRTAIRPVMSKAGLEMKRKGQAEAAGVQRGRISATWSYDVKSSADGAAVEVGPREGGAGSLAFFYFGNSKIGPRLPDPVHLAEEEATVTAEFLLAAVARVLQRGRP